MLNTIIYIKNIKSLLFVCDIYWKHIFNNKGKLLPIYDTGIQFDFTYSHGFAWTVKSDKLNNAT